MTMTTIDVSTIEPVTHPEAMRLQAEELDRALGLLRSLDAGSWSAQTDCPAWDVRAMYQHVLGACEASASIPENVRQFRRALVYRRRNGGPLEAALTAVQVRARAACHPRRSSTASRRSHRRRYAAAAGCQRSCAGRSGSRSTVRFTRPGGSAISST